MKIRDIVQERINWNALRQAKAVMPYLYDSPEARKAGVKPNPNEPNIITSLNLKQAPRPGDRLTPLPQMSPAAWQRYMDAWWQNSKTDPNAKEKVAQIRQAAADAKMPIKEFIIMPHTADPMGLIHLPGKGPNNRYGFKNVGNNRGNETKEAPPGTYFTKTGNLVKGTLSKDARERGARETDPKDNQRSKVPPVTQTNEEEHSVDLKLPTGKKMILQADDEEHTRGLVITSNEDGSYDSYYWYENPNEPMPIEVKIDGESVSKDAKNVRWEYHPELEEARGSCWHGYQQKGYKKKGNKMVPNCVKEEAAGVGIVTKQNATKDVPVGGEYMNVKKLGLGKGKPKTMREEWEEFKENFADGKKKGKSRPGRVKRSGASCKGSVTSLRSKAKKASGERAKMYHWCANMKSGRKKK